MVAVSSEGWNNWVPTLNEVVVNGDAFETIPEMISDVGWPIGIILNETFLFLGVEI